MDKNPIHTVNESLIELLPEKAVFLPEYKALLIADVHLGKVGHFRKAGMAIPRAAADQNLLQLEHLIKKYPADRVIFMGDLFHSEMNTEWLSFKEMLQDSGSASKELIGGNHDILNCSSYDRAGLLYHPKEILLGKFRLLHEPQKNQKEEFYDLCGHIHPGYTITGKGRQKLTLPCFYFGKNTGILPAYGLFTGLYPIDLQPTDDVYVCIGRESVQKIIHKKHV